MNDQSESEPQTLDAKILRAGKLNVDTIKSLDRVMRPGPHEIQAMVQSVCIRKKWSRPFLSAMMSVNPLDLRAWEIGKRKPPGVALRLLWHLYMMDTAPALAFSVLHCAMWGKVDKRPPSIVHRVEKRDRQKVIEELRANRKVWRGTHRMTAQKLADRLGVSLQTARNIAKEAEYRLADGRKKTDRKKKFPLFLKPESVYLHLDWRKSIKELSNDARVSMMSIAITRRKLLAIPEAALLRHIKSCGVNIEWFEPILKGHKRAPKAPRNKSEIVFDEILSEPIPSHANEASQEKIPEPELHSDAAEPGVSEEVQEARGENDSH